MKTGVAGRINEWLNKTPESGKTSGGRPAVGRKENTVHTVQSSGEAATMMYLAQFFWRFWPPFVFCFLFFFFGVVKDVDHLDFTVLLSLS